ncbi:phage recombination protein Bet [Xylella fastidiosa]|uniref:Phage recombination protein Bet n=1 Tax=Xylella fastidiosa TaxID=2371 RepID=A0ABC8ADS2_XYLFS|nr:phage recombination protein Bet [Xylella fastidiosa]ALR06656.1 phage recombination protein Bet [Xylella fastidiosa]ALR06743.1 phage recombination protein Bet [Xylella fastidiosa]
MNSMSVIKPNNVIPMTAEYRQSIRTALKTSLYPGATNESVEMVLAYCQAADLDPMTKPVHIVPMWIPEKKVDGRVVSSAGMRDVIMPGIELYRTKAHRTGEYAGQDEAVFGDTLCETLGGVQIRYPSWCRIAVYRMVAGERVRFAATVYWLEAYATARKDSPAPNSMWCKRPFGQLEKCAEALALRKAFPEAVGAQPTAEEMDAGRHTIEGETLHVAPIPVNQDIRDISGPYPHEEFEKNFPKWCDLIESGKTTADRIITMLHSKGKGQLTPEQLTAIRACAEDTSAEPVPTDSTPLESNTTHTEENT